MHVQCPPPSRTQPWALATANPPKAKGRHSERIDDMEFMSNKLQTEQRREVHKNTRIYRRPFHFIASSRHEEAMQRKVLRQMRVFSCASFVVLFALTIDKNKIGDGCYTSGLIFRLLFFKCRNIRDNSQPF